MNVLATVIMLVGFLAIVLYATWLFVHRLRAGASPRRSFLAWLKHLFEATWGL